MRLNDEKQAGWGRHGAAWIRARARLSPSRTAYDGRRVRPLRGIGIMAVVTLVIGLGAPGPPAREAQRQQITKRGETMTRDEFIQRLRALDPGNETAVVALAQQVQRAALEPIQAAVSEWKSDDPKLEQKAKLVLSHLDTIAIQPLIEAPMPAHSAQRVWLLRITVAQEVALRERLVSKLSRLYDDRSLVPLPPARPGDEERPRERRVCDQAYVELRRLLNCAETEDSYIDNITRFLDLTEEEKDAAISQARKSPPVWAQFVPSG